jgi:hypothetical protein
MSRSCTRTIIGLMMNLPFHYIKLRHLNVCNWSFDIILCGIIEADCPKSSAISVRSAGDAGCVIESPDTILVMSVSYLN